MHYTEICWNAYCDACTQDIGKKCALHSAMHAALQALNCTEMQHTPFELSPLIVNDASEQIYEHASQVTAEKWETQEESHSEQPAWSCDFLLKGTIYKGTNWVNWVTLNLLTTVPVFSGWSFENTILSNCCVWDFFVFKNLWQSTYDKSSDDGLKLLYLGLCLKSNSLVIDEWPVMAEWG